MEPVDADFLSSLLPLCVGQSRRTDASCERSSLRLLRLTGDDRACEDKRKRAPVAASVTHSHALSTYTHLPQRNRVSHHAVCDLSSTDSQPR